MQEDLTTLITGGNRGIGLAISNYLANCGHKVLNLSRTPAPEDYPGESFTADLTEKPATLKALARITQDYHIDNLVNNAGCLHVAPFEELLEEDIQNTIAVNVLGVLQVTQAVVPSMKKRRYGRIVNIGSRVALGKPGRTVYGLSKAAVIGLTRSLALEVAEYGITVNAVSPGPIWSGQWSDSNGMYAAKHPMAAKVPIGRMGEGKDVA